MVPGANLQVVFPGKTPFPRTGLCFQRQDSASPNRIPLPQTGFCLPKQDSVFPNRTPFPQTGFRFPRQDSVSPNRIPFPQTGLRFPKQDSVSPNRILFPQTGADGSVKGVVRRTALTSVVGRDQNQRLPVHWPTLRRAAHQARRTRILGLSTSRNYSVTAGLWLFGHCVA